MKRTYILAWIMLVLLLAGCAPPITVPSKAPTVSGTQPTVTNPTQESMVPVTNPTSDPTEPVTEPTSPATEMTQPLEYYWPVFDDVKVYPFNEAELQAAEAVLIAGLETTKDREEVLKFEVHWISFDPYYTDHSVRLNMEYSPVDGWTEDDYYLRELWFVVNFSVRYDHEVSPADDYDNQSGLVLLTRESPDGPWIIDTFSCAPYTFCQESEMLLPPEVLDELDLTDQFVLAGYRNPDRDLHILFVLDEATNTVICETYNTVKYN